MLTTHSGKWKIQSCCVEVSWQSDTFHLLTFRVPIRSETRSKLTLLVKLPWLAWIRYIFENVSYSSFSMAIYSEAIFALISVHPCHWLCRLLIFPTLYHDRSRLDDVEPWLLEWPLNLGSNYSSVWQVPRMSGEVVVKMTKKRGKVEEHHQLDFTAFNNQNLEQFANTLLCWSILILFLASLH